MPNWAWQMRRAFCSIVVNTGPRSGRTGDDAKHLRRGRLLLQRLGKLRSALGEIVGALAQLAEQPRILDGDHGLGGEVLQQVDLSIVKWPHLLSINGNDTDQFVFPDHWHPNQTAGLRKSDRGDAHAHAVSRGFAYVFY